MEDCKGRLKQYEAERATMQRELIRLRSEGNERSGTRLEQEQRMEAQRA
jgi:hypothetical protein